MDQRLRELERLASTGDPEAAIKLHELKIKLYGHADCSTCWECEQPCSVLWWRWIDSSEDIVLIHTTCGHEFSAGGYRINDEEYYHAVECEGCRLRHVSEVGYFPERYRINPDEELRNLERAYKASNDPRDAEKLNAARERAGLEPLECEKCTMALQECECYMICVDCDRMGSFRKEMSDYWCDRCYKRLIAEAEAEMDVGHEELMRDGFDYDYQRNPFRRNADIDIRTLERKYANTADPAILQRINQHRKRTGETTALSMPHLVLLAEGMANLLNIGWQHGEEPDDSKMWHGRYKGYPIGINARRIYDPEKNPRYAPFLQIGIRHEGEGDSATGMTGNPLFPKIVVYATPDESGTSITATHGSITSPPPIGQVATHEPAIVEDFEAHQPWIYSAVELLNNLVKLAKAAGIKRTQIRTRRAPTMKRQRMRQAREFRRITGLPMNVCLILSRRLLRDDKHSLDDHPLVGKYITYERGCMDPQCNCKDYQLISGPKGWITLPIWGGGWESGSKTRNRRNPTPDVRLRSLYREAISHPNKDAIKRLVIEARRQGKSVLMLTKNQRTYKRGTPEEATHFIIQGHYPLKKPPEKPVPYAVHLLSAWPGRDLSSKIVTPLNEEGYHTLDHPSWKYDGMCFIHTLDVLEIVIVPEEELLVPDREPAGETHSATVALATFGFDVYGKPYE